jgi:predicted ATPase
MQERETMHASSTSKEAMGLRIEVLGPLRVRAARREAIDRASHRRLLAILALEANRRLGTDVLIDRYWGEDVPATAKAALQTHVSALRKLLPAEVIFTEGYGYRLDLEEHSLDADEFVALAAEARQAARARRWEAALESVEAAAELWRGDPYEDLRDDDFARADIDRLEELRLELEEVRAEALIGTGQNEEALTGLEPLVRAHPLRERLWEHLMLARYRLGRHADALAAYRDAWAAFGELGLEPGAELRRLEQKILLHDKALAGAGARHNLPTELTTFVGRERELSEVSELLAHHRLVTLTGVPGTGKTRLALQVAAHAADGFPDGRWLAELAALRDPNLVPLEVAGAIGLKPGGDEVVEALVRAIARDTALVVLDNCEHLLAETAALSRALLEAAQDIRIVATSREPLRVPGEVVYEVPPMSFPGDRSADPEELRAFDSVRLFEERARLARPSFVLDSDDPSAVGRICRRLDGVPLAIELAAARVGSLSPATIAQRLDDCLRILTEGSTTGPERHQTLEAAFHWSYDLLDAREQLLFARLSVFRGGFTLDMAEDVCSRDGIDARDVVPVVSALVEKSLVSRVGDEPMLRYRLLETAREYAAARLDEAGDPDALHHRHLDWCVRFADDVNARAYGERRDELFERLGTETDNLQAALEWSAARRTEVTVGRLARALAWHWWGQGHLERVIASLETALAGCTDIETEAEVRALLARARFDVGDDAAAYSEAERAYELASRLSPSPARLVATTVYAGLHRLLVDRDPARAIPLGEEAVEVAEALGDHFHEIRALVSLGQALVWSGRDLGRGLAHIRRALDLALRTGDPAVVVDTYAHMCTALYLDPVARRTEPARITEQLLTLLPLEDRDRENASGWLPWVLLQSGQWARAEQVMHRTGGTHLEGFDRTGFFVVHGALRWMQGRLDEADVFLAEIRDLGVNPRWYHDYFPLVADVAADAGRLADVRTAAETYLSVQVDPSEEAKKLGVLSPLARAEVDAALATSGSERAQHLERARAAVAKAREILQTYPPAGEGSVQMETHTTHLAFAEAELSRIDGPEPGRWQDAVDRADYFYFRLYARRRLAEALLSAGGDEAGAGELRAAHAEATRVGAGRIRQQLEQLANGAGVRLTTRPRAGSRF